MQRDAEYVTQEDYLKGNTKEMIYEFNKNMKEGLTDDNFKLRDTTWPY